MRRWRSLLTAPNILIGIALGILTMSVWAYLNRPEKEPPWPKKVQGFSYSPMRANENPLVQVYPTEQEIEEDLQLLSDKAYAIRTYSLDDVFEKIPEMAAKYNLNVALGGWIDKNLDKNEIEIQRLIRTANKNRNVVRVIVGNEAVLRGDVTVDQMISYLDRVRREVKKPVSTAEPWHVWVKYTELADHVDYLAVHMLPYWEGIDMDVAVEYVVQNINALKLLFPNKPIVITEVGWPSNGRTRRAAVASPSNEAMFLRRFLKRAEEEKYIYYVMEAFDQPWKQETEGAVGAYWGVYDVNRRPKFSFTEPIVAIPNWYIFAGISVLIGLIILAVLFVDSEKLKTRGRSFLAIIAYSAATVAVWVVYEYTHQYLTFTSVIVGVLMITGMVGVIVIILTEAHEWVEALWFKNRERQFTPPPVDDARLPMVSIHVPCYNEPPEMMKETLDALSRLDYPRYEVIVIDNNTKDPNVWKPVEEHCALLGEKFRFYHVDPLSGFKAGALNFALRMTSPDAEIVAVIDSDYVVDRRWLRDLVPYFSKDGVAIVQAPQDYRDDGKNAFKAMCYAEYSGFFFIGMITRNERNAIIQHGTMTMVRKKVLLEVGGWSEWCITEDAELGLKIFERGYEAIYIPKSYGMGLMPDNFNDYRKQRFRWAYGAIQILKRHFKELLGIKKTSLTYGQRYHFIAGWLPWIADAMNLFFSAAAIIWSVAMILFPKKIDPPMVEFAALPIALFSFKVGKVIYLYRARINAPIRYILGAALAGLALSHTIAYAVLLGFFTKDKPFYRTPKMARTNALLQAIDTARVEFLIMLSLLTCAFILSLREGFMVLDMQLWIIVLIMQSLPYAATILVAFISAIPGLPAWLFKRRDVSLRNVVIT